MQRVAVIGTGFSAYTVIRQLIKAQIDFDLFDVSDSAPDFENLESDANLWAANPFIKTKKFLGGIDLWGGAQSRIRFPEDFRRTDDPTWYAIGKQLFEAGGFTNGPSDNRLVKESRLEEIGKSLTKFGFKERTVERTEVRLFAKKARKLLSNFRPVSIREISRLRKSIDQYQISWSDNQDPKRVQNARYSAIFACSGPLGNAYLTALVSGHTTYAWGDHLTLVSGRFSSKDFLLPRSESGIWGPFNSAISIYQYQRIEKGAAQSASLRIGPNFNFAGLPSREATLIQKVGLYREFNLHWILDRSLSSGSSLEFSDLQMSKPRYAIALGQIGATQTLNEALQRSTQAFEKLDFQLSVNEDLFTSREQFFRSHQFSAQHPYGTVPAVEGTNGPSVGQSLELRGFDRFFVVGGSAIPDGTLDHPTPLIIALAKLAANRYINQSFD